ncbi:hypothetical protein F511_47105 [Dorcoceras hygrometricum]|uniref:Uncharacterized protein n=1 Tax=Dorcoceras hygrometricum TaxID=472368 RepID=A0A2Z6ZZ60_9LAMI|nr:hypothetical protein F511_47105 [Dorcoceras hygrometricum]
MKTRAGRTVTSLLAARCGALAAGLERDDGALLGRDCATILHGGRRDVRHCRHTMLRRWPDEASVVARLVDARCALDARCARNVVRRRAEILVCGGRRPAAAPAPLRRISGDVVTAGMNSFRVWFGPVPGCP